VLCGDGGFAQTGSDGRIGGNTRCEFSDDGCVNIVTAKMRVSVRREDLKYTRIEFEDRDVERSATKIEHGDF
jgi:hypothetical protein